MNRLMPEEADKIKFPIYMDYHATTPVDPRVVEVMLPYLTEHFGNPSSNQVFGWVAREAVEAGREKIASLIGAGPDEIVFTSGATESNNLAIKGVAQVAGSGHIVTSAIEHKAVLESVRWLESQGLRATYVPCDAQGIVQPQAVADALQQDTVLVSVMAANNEVGTLQPIAEIGRFLQERGILFHTDAAQAVGKIPFNVDDLNVDMVSFTSHKLYGPKGIGALYIRRKRPRIKLAPILDGGGHEGGLRSGTLNPAAVAGFGEACRIAGESLAEEPERIRKLRDTLQQALLARLDQTLLNGHPSQRLPGNLNISFLFVEGESLLMGLQDIAVSSGAACSSAIREPSYVLMSLGRTPEQAYASVRFGLGRFTTPAEVDFTIQKVVSVVERLRSMSREYHKAAEPAGGATG